MAQFFYLNIFYTKTKKIIFELYNFTNKMSKRTEYGYNKGRKS